MANAIGSGDAQMAASGSPSESRPRHLDPGTTKKDEGRMLYLTEELYVRLTPQQEQVRALEQQRGKIIPCVFPNLSGRHRGERIHDFKET